MSDRPDLYAVLGVSSNATLDEIQAAYRQRVQVVHPDRIDRGRAPQAWEAANSMLAELNAAYTVLSDPALRHRFDGRPLDPKAGVDATQSPPPPPPPGSEARPAPAPARSARLWLVVGIGVVIVWIVLFDQRTNNVADNLVTRGSSGVPVPTPSSPTESVISVQCETEEFNADFGPRSDPQWNGIWKFTPLLEDIPSNATVWRSTDTKPVAPLTIRASGTSHFLVKLEDGRANTSFVFVRAGATAETLVPLGTYTLKYATGSGSQWCGREARRPFGTNTSFYRADSTFVFSDEGSHYSGHTIELIRQVGGNLSTSSLPASKW